jgi:hypothetical protein
MLLRVRDKEKKLVRLHALLLLFVIATYMSVFC